MMPKLVTFPTISLLQGVPLGKLNTPGIPPVLLNVKHIVNETMHWNQVMNRGASSATAWLLNKLLLTNTVAIDTTL